MDDFFTAFDNYPIHSGFILIGIGIICLIFRLDSDNKEGYKDRSLFGKTSIIDSWGIIIMLILFGVILIVKTIL